MKTRALIGVALILLIACSTSFEEVPIQLPRLCAVDVETFERPLIVDVVGHGHRLIGRNSSTPKSIGLPKGPQSFRVRFGLCEARDLTSHRFRCDSPTFFGESTVRLNPGEPAQRIQVPTVPSVGCVPSAASTGM